MDQQAIRRWGLGLVVSAALLVAGRAEATQYGRVAIVAVAGGDYSSLQAAFAELYTVWCPQPTADSPCLVKVMAGKFPVSGTITVPRYVDVVGSGPDATRVTGGAITIFSLTGRSEVRDLTVEQINTTAYGPSAVSIAGDSRLRHVNVKVTSNAGGSAISTSPNVYGTSNALVGVNVDAAFNANAEGAGVSVTNFGTTTLTGCAVNVTNGGTTSAAYAIGLDVESSSNVIVNGSRIGATTTGGTAVANALKNFVGTARLAGSQLSASGPVAYAVINWLDASSQAAGTVVLDASQVFSTGTAYYAMRSSTNYIGASKLEGAALVFAPNGANALVCASSYDGGYRPLSPACAVAP